MSKNLEDLLPYVRPHVPGCPEPMMIDKLRSKVRELCERSQVWREYLPKLDVYKDIKTYDLNVPYNMRIVAVRAVDWDGDPIPFYSINDLKRTDDYRLGEYGYPYLPYYPNSDATASRPDYWTLDMPERIRFEPAPDQDYDAIVEPYAAVTLAENESVFHDDLMRFAEGIGMGAAASLMLMPKQPWTDRDGYQEYHRLFEADVGDAKLIAMGGENRKAQRAASAGFNPP